MLGKQAGLRSLFNAKAAAPKPQRGEGGLSLSDCELDIALVLGTELTKMMIRVTVTESAPFPCRQGAKQRMVS